MQTFLDAMPMTKEKNDRSLTTSDMEPDRSTGTRCQIEYRLIHVNNPRTYYYVIDLSNSTLSRAQSVDMSAYRAPANITPSSVDWRASPTESGHLDRQTGMMTLNLGSYAMSFACQRTGGI